MICDACHKDTERVLSNDNFTVCLNCAIAISAATMAALKQDAVMCDDPGCDACTEALELMQ